MGIFGRSRKRNFRSLKKIKQLRRKKEQERLANSKKNDILEKTISTFLHHEKEGIYYRRKNNGEEYYEEETIEQIKESLFNKDISIITEKDLIKNCIIFDRTNGIINDKNNSSTSNNNKLDVLKRVSYLILYAVLKKTINYESVLMQVEEFGFPVEKIRDRDDEEVNICSRYKSDVFFSYLYSNLQMIKTNKNFHVLCKLMNIILSISKIMPYLYKIKFLFCFCSLFNIYQKELDEEKEKRKLATIEFDAIENDTTGKVESKSVFSIVDHNYFLHLFFEVMTKLSNLQTNYNDFDKNYNIFNFFVVRWLLVYFKNKYTFFLNRKGNSFMLCKYVVLLFNLLKQCHETAYSKENINKNVDGVIICNEDGNSHPRYEEESLKKEHVIIHDEEIKDCTSNPNNLNGGIIYTKNIFSESRRSGEATNLLNDLCAFQKCPNEKIEKTKIEIKNMIEIFYSKVNIQIEENVEMLQYTLNNITSSIFMCVYNSFEHCDIFYKHLIMVHFSCRFLKLRNLEYSYFVVFNSFQFINKLLTVENVSIHPILFLALRETFTFCEEVIIHLYEKKQKDSEEEFYKFCEQFHLKHNKLYSGLIRRVWNLYLLIISEEFVKSKNKLNTESEETDTIQKIPLKNGIDNEKIIDQNDVTRYNIPIQQTTQRESTLLKITPLTFSKAHKEFLLEKIDNSYKNSLVSCLAQAFRVIGFSHFFDEMYFFSNTEIIAKDVFYINKFIEDINKSYSGGNFKFLLNFFYPLLNFYINLYEKETSCLMKKQHFFVFIKNVLTHFTRCLNDCINLYYFLSTDISDLFILVTKLLRCTNYAILELFLCFIQHLYMSTLKLKHKDAFTKNNFFDMGRIESINIKYTKVNYLKNEYFLNNISEHLLKLVLARYAEIYSVYMEHHFSSIKRKEEEKEEQQQQQQQQQHQQQQQKQQQNSDNRKSIAVTLHEFARLIYVCAYFIPQEKIAEVITMIEQFASQESLGDNIYSLFCFLNTVTILIHFFSIAQIYTCCNAFQRILLLTENQWKQMIPQKREEDVKELYNTNDNNNNDVIHHISEMNSNIPYVNDTNGSQRNAVKTGNLNKLLKNRNSMKYSIKYNAKREEKKKKKVKITAFKNKNEKLGGQNGPGLISERVHRMQKKRNRNRKEHLEKLHYVQILILESISEIYKIFGNIFYKKRMELKNQNQNQSQSRKRKRKSKSKKSNTTGKQDIDVCLNENELQLFNSICVEGRIIEKNLPLMLQRDIITLYFSRASDLSKYTKKIYHYMNSFTYFLKEAFFIDSSYCYSLFYDMLPLMMKSLFVISKSFSSKFQKHVFFQNMVDIGKYDIPKFMYHIIPGVMIDSPVCHRISIYILYILINKYKLDVLKQKEILDMFLALAASNKNNMLKFHVKFLLTAISKFDKEIVFTYLTNITKLINKLPFISFKYMISKCVLKLRDIVIESGQEDKDFINSLTKTNRVLLRRALKKKKQEQTYKQIQKEILQSDQIYRIGRTDLNDQHNQNDQTIQKDLKREQNKNGIKIATKISDNLNNLRKSKGQKDCFTNSSNLEMSSDSISTDDDDDDDDSVSSISSFANEENSDSANEENKPKSQYERASKRERLRSLKKQIENNSGSSSRGGEYVNWDVFFNVLKSSRTNEETQYIQQLLKKVTDIKSKNKNDNEYKKNMCAIFSKLQTAKSSKLKKKNGVISADNAFALTSFEKGKKNKSPYKHSTSAGTNKKKKAGKNKKNVSDTEDEDEEKEDDIRFNDEGKMIISIMANKHSSKKNKKKDNDELEKQKLLLHSKYGRNRKNKQKKEELFITKDKSAYKSKKGKGDIIKKNQLLPYSYVALKPVMAKEKFRKRVLNTFQSIKGHTKGRQ